jgi:hypothetical protein
MSQTCIHHQPKEVGYETEHFILVVTRCRNCGEFLEAKAHSKGEIKNGN